MAASWRSSSTDTADANLIIGARNGTLCAIRPNVRNYVTATLRNYATVGSQHSPVRAGEAVFVACAYPSALLAHSLVAAPHAGS